MESDSSHDNVFDVLLTKWTVTKKNRVTYGTHFESLFFREIIQEFST